MYIEPNTTIRLLSGVPLTPDYTNTLYWTDATAQTNYMTAATKHRLDKQSYQRVNRGMCKIGVDVGDVIDCNYMMFKNNAFEGKWFYAFITSTEYVNNGCTLITFELDVLQTWMFEWEIKSTFVEREHVVNDNIGANLEPEPVDLGEYVFNSYDSVTPLTSMCVIIAIVDSEHLSGTLYDGIYGATVLWVYSATDVQNINNKIAEYTKSPDSIISIYMCPLGVVGSIPDSHILPYGASGFIQHITLPGTNSDDRLDNYKPVNNKLYTYPYNYLHMDNAMGSSVAYRYEFFKSSPVVTINGTVTQPVQVTLRPAQYKGVEMISQNKPLHTETLTLSNYPICSWSVDSYQAWLAQNSLPLALNNITGVGSAIAGAALLGASPIAGAITAVGAAASVLSQGYKASVAADMSKGAFNNGSVNVSCGYQQFYYGRCSISYHKAAVIDDFFSRFGYAINRLKIPNISARPEWSYIKTSGSTIIGNFDTTDQVKINSIFNAGITFWRNPAHVGEYWRTNHV